MLVSTICTGAINKLGSGLTEIFGVFFFSDKYIDTITGRTYGNSVSVKKEKEQTLMAGDHQPLTPGLRMWEKLN